MSYRFDLEARNLGYAVQRYEQREIEFALHGAYVRGSSDEVARLNAALGVVAFVQWAERSQNDEHVALRRDFLIGYEQGWDNAKRHLLTGGSIAFGIAALVGWARENGQPLDRRAENGIGYVLGRADERGYAQQALGVVAFVQWAQRRDILQDLGVYTQGYRVGYHRGETNAAEDSYAVLGIVAFVQWARVKPAGRYPLRPARSTDYDKGWDAGLTYALDKRRGQDIALGLVGIVSWARENGQPTRCNIPNCIGHFSARFRLDGGNFGGEF